MVRTWHCLCWTTRLLSGGHVLLRRMRLEKEEEMVVAMVEMEGPL